MRNPAHVRVGHLIKTARARTRRTQKELARMAGIAATTLARYEIGSQSTPRGRLLQLAELLGAPELAEVARERAEFTEPVRITTPRGAAQLIGRDLFSAREDAYDWWLQRADQLRRKDKLSPARIDAIRVELSRTTSSMSASAELSTQEVSDKFLLECLESLLQVQLKFERLSAVSKPRNAA